MNTLSTYFFKKIFVIILFLLTIFNNYSQTTMPSNSKSDFWQKVQFGGGLGLSFGNFTNVTVSPSAIYHVNDMFSVGTGLQFAYVAAKDSYSSTMYGGSIITLFNPSESIQLSAEIEQLQVNRTFTSVTPNIKDNFWNTALFAGAGYRAGNVTIGGRYNLLFNKDKNIYGTAFMPFVRVFF